MSDRVISDDPYEQRPDLSPAVAQEEAPAGGAGLQARVTVLEEVLATIFAGLDAAAQARVMTGLAGQASGDPDVASGARLLRQKLESLKRAG